ncbi:PK beta-barrel-protein domain-containing protein-like protein [Microthyrium microscopicum]|uniref:PK beta-barrel-protein domain-containing protein-like protein n=1 Tax=Microthyrium microscopicum TaxID=703497 RepID=A0A6A6USC7_9PEZI|nr:PK beta-barrel-protein domain-containing protein-like protein [Microthyrium microscopicum]
MSAPVVHSTHLSSSHSFSKTYTPSITLVPNHGVQGDIHSGPSSDGSTNLRQVHLIAYELLSQLAAYGISVAPGQLGENITTAGLDLLNLPRGTYLYFGDKAIVQVVGVREAGPGIERFRKGLSELVPRGVGVMGMVVGQGDVGDGDTIRVVFPDQRVPLGPV